MTLPNLRFKNFFHFTFLLFVRDVNISVISSSQIITVKGIGHGY